MKTRVLKKNISNDTDTSELNDLFEQMTGSQNADPDIIIPKIIKISELINKIIKLYNMLLKFDDFINSFNECTENFKEIEGFVKKLVDLNTTIETVDKLKLMTNDDINKKFNDIKNAKEIQSLIITSSNLSIHKRFIIDKNNLKDEFIKREPGLVYTPLVFSKLDFKFLWNSPKITDMAKKYLLSIISYTFNISLELYDIITSPNIDIKKFSKVLLLNIDKMKKMIPRCDKAFDVIKNSVEMLEDNFKGYYKSSVESANPSVIIESFIVDVSLTQKSNATITGQFRKIIMHMKKQAANNTDPRVKKLFKILNSQFDLMAKSTGVEPVDDDPEPNQEPPKQPDTKSKTEQTDVEQTDVEQTEVEQTEVEYEQFNETETMNLLTNMLQKFQVDI